METSFLRIKSVIERTGLPRSTIYARAKDGTFPRPVKIGVKASAWPSTAIDAWIDRQLEAAQQSPQTSDTAA